ncbi:MAG: hypothetical protein CM1200mP15_17540 [Dehalococcoidia bacterium]|nr:MAG: hypothetical protein CM1200mP15_17540 [Dehalococcoidia bacterium]
MRLLHYPSCWTWLSYLHTDTMMRSQKVTRIMWALQDREALWKGHEAMSKADVILAFGTRINQASTSWDYSIINPDTKIIQVDIDPIEIGRNYPVVVGIVGDATAVGQQLINSITSGASGGNTLPDWKEILWA